MAYLGVKLNIGLAIFNLLPIPPLDGSKILAKFLPWSLRSKYLSSEMIGFLVILFLSFTGILGRVLYPLLTIFSNFILYYTGLAFKA
jgi:Zn-dependent protease